MWLFFILLGSLVELTDVVESKKKLMYLSDACFSSHKHDFKPFHDFKPLSNLHFFKNLCRLLFGFVWCMQCKKRIIFLIKSNVSKVLKLGEKRKEVEFFSCQQV